MIKKWGEFIREYSDSSDENIIDKKMQEIKDLVDGISDGNNMIYEWENKGDHELTVSFSTGELSLRYNFDIDQLSVTKQAGDIVDFVNKVDSIEKGLSMIEKDIQSIIGMSESKDHHNNKSMKDEIIECFENAYKSGSSNPNLDYFGKDWTLFTEEFKLYDDYYLYKDAIMRTYTSPSGDWYSTKLGKLKAQPHVFKNEIFNRIQELEIAFNKI